MRTGCRSIRSLHPKNLPGGSYHSRGAGRFFILPGCPALKRRPDQGQEAYSPGHHLLVAALPARGAPGCAFT